jgi:hypothetical protein
MDGKHMSQSLKFHYENGTGPLSPTQIGQTA